MKKINFLLSILSLIASLSSFAAQAELTVGVLQNPDKVKAKVDAQIDAYVQNHRARDTDDYSGHGYYTLDNNNNSGDVLYTINFNSNSYIAAISTFNHIMAPLDNCKSSALPTASCALILGDQNVCHLNLINLRTLTLNSVIPLHIVRAHQQLEGMPYCNVFKAMSIAKEATDSLLMTLEYFDNAVITDPRNPAPEFTTTLLLRFSDNNGQLKIEQDDSCLGNPNNYKTIATAHKALKQCASKN